MFGLTGAQMMQYSIIANMTFLGIIVIFFIFAGPAIRTFMTAKVRNRPVAIVARNDRRFDMVTGNYMAGTIDTKKYGPYAIIPQTSYILWGVTCVIVHENFAAALPQSFIKAATVLKDEGIETYEEAEGVANTIGTEGFSKKMEDMKKKAESGDENAKREYMEALESIGRTTESIHVVQNFFKYDFNPASVRHIINRAVSEVIQDYKKFDVMKWVFAIGMLCIFAALAFVMIQSGAPQQAASTVSSSIGAGLG